MKHGSRSRTAQTIAAPEVAIPAAAISKGANVTGNVVQAPIDTVTSHSHEGVLLWSLLLLGMATWAGFGKPTWDVLIGNTQQWNTTISPRLVLGGIVFCVVLAMIADSSDDAATVIILMLVGMWILFVMMNGLPTIQSVFKWFQSGKGLSINSMVGGGASRDFGNVSSTQERAAPIVQGGTPPGRGQAQH